MAESRIEADYRELKQLKENYAFQCSIFHKPDGVITIIVECDFVDVGPESEEYELDSFNFKLQYESEAELHSVEIPHDAYIPNVLREKSSLLRGHDPAMREMIRRGSPVPYSIKLDEDQKLKRTVELVEEIFAEINVKKKGSVKDTTTTEEVRQVASRAKKFRVKSIEDELQILKAERPRSSREQLISTSNDTVPGNYSLYIEPGALQAILSHIQWTRRTENNVVEQGGIYIGTPCMDPDGLPFGLAKAAIAAKNTAGTSTYVEFSHDIWISLLNDFDRRKEAGALGEDWVILGWYHTHPNNLSVFMSGTDMRTQERLFNKSWNSALVMNPHRELIAGFHGPQARPCNVFRVLD